MSNPVIAKIKARIAKAGSLLCVDEGEYDAYSVIGFYVALKDFLPYKELDLFLTDNPEQREPYHFDNSTFLAALIAKGLLLKINHATLYMGSSFSAENFLFKPTVDEA